jgi:hypothetical protein
MLFILAICIYDISIIVRAKVIKIISISLFLLTPKAAYRQKTRA